MIATHPVAGPDDQTLRWRMSAELLPPLGEALQVPEPLATPLREGAVTRVVVTGQGVEITLAADRSWRTDGPALRTALLAALELPGEWATAPADRCEDDDTRDERLSLATEQALAGQVGDFARSHGGRIELESVRDGVVTVRMSGACHGCPAAGVTLHARLERTLRQDHPELKQVRAVQSAQSGPPLTWLTQQGRRRPHA